MTDPDSTRRTARSVFKRCEHLRAVHAPFFFRLEYYRESYYGTIPTSAAGNAQNPSQSNVCRVFLPSTFSPANLRMCSPGRSVRHSERNTPSARGNLFDELTRYLTANPSARSLNRKVVGTAGSTRRCYISDTGCSDDAERQSAKRFAAASQTESGSDDSRSDGTGAFAQ